MLRICAAYPRCKFTINECQGYTIKRCKMKQFWSDHTEEYVKLQKNKLRREKRNAKKIKHLMIEGKNTATHGRFVPLDFQCNQNIYIRGPYDQHPTKGSSLVGVSTRGENDE